MKHLISNTCLAKKSAKVAVRERERERESTDPPSAQTEPYASVRLGGVSRGCHNSTLQPEEEE